MESGNQIDTVSNSVARLNPITTPTSRTGSFSRPVNPLCLPDDPMWCSERLEHGEKVDATCQSCGRALEYGLDVSRHKGKTGHSDYMGKEGCSR